MTVGELEGMGDDGISRQPVHGLFVWVSTRALFSTPCSIYLFARQGRNHYTFYLDTPYIPFTLLSTSISCPVFDCGGRLVVLHLEICFLSSILSSARWDDAWVYDEQGAQFGGQCQALGFHCLDGRSILYRPRNCYELFGVWIVNNINSTSCFASNPFVHIRPA